MKRVLCAMLAAMLVCLSAGALADAELTDDVIDAFCQTWVREDGEGYTVDIVYDDEEQAFEFSGVRFVSDNEYYSLDFERCEYDQATGALICENGLLTHDVIDEAEDVEDVYEELASGFGAVLTLDGNGRLLWTGSGDVLEDQALVIETEEDDGDPFTGEWECADVAFRTEKNGDMNDVFVIVVDSESDWTYMGTVENEVDAEEYAALFGGISVYIEKNGDRYEAFVMWQRSLDEMNYWDYDCALDEATGTLVGTGVKTIEIETGEDEPTQTEAYADGGVTFTLDNGALLWNDAVENAGKNLRFTLIEESEENL